MNDFSLAFQQAYDTLNPAQRQAVDTIEGPVMVIAGPGTGKTQILTLRIANILRTTDTPPEAILAITFTEAGAKNMRMRLRSFIGDAAYRVPIYTFHSFAHSIIAQYPDAVPRIIGGRAITELEKIRLINDILTADQYTVLRPAGKPDYYVQPLLSAIQSLKQEQVRPDDLAVIIQRLNDELALIPQVHERGAHKGKPRGEYLDAMKRLTKLTELSHCYRTYEAMLRSAHLYDFDDMLGEVVVMLETDESSRIIIQENYQYVLADEHQDVNASQNKLLSLLTNFHDQPNIFVVGDEKQAIFRFQGASLDNFLYFENLFGQGTTIALTHNYRSGQNILDVAHNLVATDDPLLAPLRVPLVAAALDSAHVTLTEFSHDVIEDQAVISWVQALRAADTNPSEIAIIVRTNRYVMHFTKLLRQAGIAVAPSADIDVLDHPLFTHVTNVIGAVLSPSNVEDLTAVLHASYSEISATDLVRVLRAQSRSTPLESIVTNQALREAAMVENHAPFERITRWLLASRESLLTRSPSMVLEELLDQSGLLAHVLAHEPFESTTILRRLYDEVATIEGSYGKPTLGSVHAYLKELQSYHIPVSVSAYTLPGKAVVVTTAHRAKGLEYEAVYIPRVTDTVWGKGASRTLFDLSFLRHNRVTDEIVMDDERRLLYVALTRAKHTLCVSYATTNAQGTLQLPSRFLADMAMPVRRDDTPLTSELSMSHIKAAPTTHLDTTSILAILLEQGLSATALNNFIKSPWQFIYQNLLRVPHFKSVSAEYGTALHAVLRTLQQRFTAHTLTPTTTDIALLLTQALDRTNLPIHELTKLHERGLAALTAFEPHRITTSLPSSSCEVSVTADWETGLVEFPILRLTGNLDRIDFKDGNIVRVVDYKSGKPKSRGEILGTTKHSHGSYFRQLVFYAFLLSLQPDKSMHCRTGMLSFIEPNARGVIKEESFDITDSDIENLQEELRSLVSTMVHGTYRDLPCDPEACDYCNLVQLAQR